MGTRTHIGETGDLVRRRIKETRQHQRLSLAELSTRLTRAGHPILMSGLSKIENGGRRVDVDDLVAVAAALGVPPGVLLSPADAESDPATVSRMDELDARLKALEAWASGMGMPG